MSTDENTPAWWKSQHLYGKMSNALIPALIVGLLIYLLAKSDQQFTDQNARLDTKFDILFEEISKIRVEIAVINTRVTNLETEVSEIKARVRQLETNQQKIISSLEAHEEEHARLAE